MLKDKILIISAHPDDMELSCGAFASFLASRGFQIKSVIVASERRGQKFPDGQAVGFCRRAEAMVASHILTIPLPQFLLNYIWELDYNNLLLQLKEIQINERPDIIFTHFPVDGHLDHSIIGTVLYEIFQNSKDFDRGFDKLNPSNPADFKLVFFKSPGSYSFVPSYVFDITPELIEKKWLALQAHKSQRFNEVPIEVVKKTEEFILARRYGDMEVSDERSYFNRFHID